MTLWHKSHQENVWLILLWMKNLQQAYYNQQHPLDAAHTGLKKEPLDTDTGVWCPLLATVLHWPWISPWTPFFFMHSSFLTDLHCVSADGTAQMSWTEAVVGPEVVFWWMSQRDMPFWTAHGSRYMLICFKDWLEVFPKLQCCLYIWRTHMMKVLITFALTAQRTIPLFVKCRSSVFDIT